MYAMREVASASEGPRAELPAIVLVHYLYEPHRPAGWLPYQTATCLLHVLSRRRYGRRRRLLAQFRGVIGDEQVCKLLWAIYRPQVDTHRPLLRRKSCT